MRTLMDLPGLAVAMFACVLICIHTSCMQATNALAILAQTVGAQIVLKKTLFTIILTPYNAAKLS